MIQPKIPVHDGILLCRHGHRKNDSLKNKIGDNYERSNQKDNRFG